jgi:hypothetical protein
MQKTCHTINVIYTGEFHNRVKLMGMGAIQELLI